MKLKITGMGDHWGETDQPDFDPDVCSVRISVDIGIDGQEEGVNFFYIQVVTPTYLQTHGSPRWGKGILVVNAFDWDEVERLIEEQVAGITAGTWDEAVRTLSHYLDWEYEGMRSVDAGGVGVVKALIKRKSVGSHISATYPRRRFRKPTFGA
jgi:hypothetical protein